MNVHFLAENVSNGDSIRFEDKVKETNHKKWKGRTQLDRVKLPDLGRELAKKWSAKLLKNSCQFSDPCV